MPGLTSDQTLLITGATGFVGKTVAQQLQAHGYSCVTPTRTELDLLDHTAVTAYLRQTRPDVVIHCAGKVGGIQANMADPVGFLADNMRMGIGLIDAAYSLSIPRFINLGSSCMYPRNWPDPLDESILLAGPLEPTNAGYALAKIATAQLCQSITETTELSYKTLIPCNLYGPGDAYAPHRSHVIAAAIQKIVTAQQTGAETVTIWGDGTPRREVMVVGDLAECILRSLTHNETLPTVMNVGPGTDITINTLYQTIAERVGYTGMFVHDMSRPQGMTHKCLSVDRMHSWGWQPPTSLVEGIERTLQHDFKQARVWSTK
jgi:GDP-L-fucose synthase